MKKLLIAIAALGLLSTSAIADNNTMQTNNNYETQDLLTLSCDKLMELKQNPPETAGGDFDKRLASAMTAKKCDEGTQDTNGNSDSNN